jgi:hypothetical protein
MLWMIAISTTRQKLLEKKFVQYFSDKFFKNMLGGGARFSLLVT